MNNFLTINISKYSLACSGSSGVVANFGDILDSHSTLFENAIKAYIDAEDYNYNEVVAVSSKSLALHYALKAVGVKRGELVCVPSFAPEEILVEIKKLKAIPVFVGSEDDTWNMSHGLLEDAISNLVSVGHWRPKAVIMCAAYGMPSVVHRICEVCGRFCIPLIDYAFDAMGSEYYGHRLGMFGQLGYGIISFEEGNIVSCGGAALISGDKERKEIVLNLMSKHKTARMLSKCAEVGLAQMADIDKRIAHNRHIQSLYENLLKDVEGIIVHAQFKTDTSYGQPPYFNSNYHKTTVLLDKNIDIEEFRKHLLNVGVETQRLYTPLHTYPEYVNHPKYTNGVCEDLYNRGLCLPLGSAMTDDDVMAIVVKIKNNLCGRNH